MKKKGATCIHADKRNMEIWNTYKRVIREVKVIRYDDVMSKVADAPYSQFWVSEKRTARVLEGLLNGKKMLDGMNPYKRAMYVEIFCRALMMKTIYKDISTAKLASLVVHTKAPRLYLSPAYVSWCISQIRNRTTS